MDICPAKFLAVNLKCKENFMRSPGEGVVRRVSKKEPRMDVTEELSRGIIAKKSNVGKDGERAGDVNEDEKNRIISEAVATWKRMGLSREQIAFGIAAMNIESGFNPGAKGTSKSEKGLGQFTDETWKDAINAYNRDKDKTEKKIDPSVLSNSGNASDQIKVMGRWIKEAWHDAKKFKDFLVGHPVSEDYKIKFIDIAYALWHGGVNVKKAADVNDIIKEFLANNKANKKFFNGTYNQMLKNLDPVKFDERTHGGSHSETLRRDGSDYRKVHRIEPDGSTRGYFESD